MIYRNLAPANTTPISSLDTQIEDVVTTSKTESDLEHANDTEGKQ